MDYSNDMFNGKRPNEYIKQGNTTTYAIDNGSKIVQQTDINWSKRILGKEALTQINIKTNKAVFIAKFIG